jgi:hypothetical protein
MDVCRQATHLTQGETEKGGQRRRFVTGEVRLPRLIGGAGPAQGGGGRGSRPGPKNFRGPEQVCFYIAQYLYLSEKNWQLVSWARYRALIHVPDFLDAVTEIDTDRFRSRHRVIETYAIARPRSPIRRVDFSPRLEGTKARSHARDARPPSPDLHRL